MVISSQSLFLFYFFFIVTCKRTAGLNLLYMADHYRNWVFLHN